MLRRQPIFQALDPMLIGSGLQLDKHPLLAAVWSAAENVTFYGGKVRRRKANALAFADSDATLPVRGLSQQMTTSGTRYIWAAMGSIIVRWYGPVQETMAGPELLVNNDFNDGLAGWGLISGTALIGNENGNNFARLPTAGGASLLFQTVVAQPTATYVGVEDVRATTDGEWEARFDAYHDNLQDVEYFSAGLVHGNTFGRYGKRFTIGSFANRVNAVFMRSARGYGSIGDITAASVRLVGKPWQRNQTANRNATFWDFLHYGDWTVANDGQGQAQIYKPSIGYFLPFGNAPADVTVFLKKLNYVLAFGYGARGTAIAWCDADNIEQWTPTAENSAGDLVIDDLNTRIAAACPIGSSIAVYAEDQMALVSYIGAPFYFSQRVALDGIGAVGKYAVAGDGRVNVGVGRGGVWWTDSNSYRYLDEGYMHDYLQEQVNWDQRSKITAARNDFTGCFEFFFPMRGALENNEGWSVDPRTGGWSPIAPASLKDERRLFDAPIVGLSNGRVLLDQASAFAAGSLSLRTKPLLMQYQTQDGIVSSHSISRVDEFQLLLKAERNVEVRIGSSLDVDDEPSWSAWLPCQADMTTYQPGPMPDGIYWWLDFRSTDGSDWDLDLQGFQFFGTIDGVQRKQQ